MIDKRKDIEGAKAGSKPKKPYIQKDTVASTQTAEIVYGIGEGENAGLISGLQSIILDGTRVVGANGEVNYNEVKYEERVGLIEQEPLKLIEDTATERSLNLEVTNSNPIVSTFNNSDVDKFVVRMSIPQLMQNKDNGDSVATSVSYAIDIAVDGGPFVEVLTHTVSEKITNGYEIEHELDTPEGSVRLVRVRRLTGDSTSQMVANKTYVAGIVEIITAKFTHPALHYVGLTFNAENFNGIPKAVFHYKGRKIQIPTNYNPETRTYTGIWDGTFKVMYSNNPAWVLYDMLTHRRFGLGRRIPNELVDKWELYRIGAYCDEMVPDGNGGLEPRFVCNNLVLNSKEDAYKVIKDMASIFRGQAFWNGTQVITSADIPRDVEYAISMASVKDYSYSGTSRAARHNVIKVQYYDKANEYKAAYEFATDYDSIRELGEINELEIRAFGCDSPGQAQRLARYTLLSEQTETRILTATIALDGMVNMQIGDIFAWSDRLLAGAENGGRVVAVNGLEVTLDRDVTNSALVGDTLYVNTADGKAAIREITAVAGNKITVDQELPNVEQEFVWVIDSEQLSLLFFRLDSVRVSPVDNVVEITGTQHVNSKFAAVDTETALEAPPFSKIEIDTLRAPENVTLTYNVRVDQGINIADLYVAWGQVKGATRYTVEFRRDQQPWRTLGVVTGLTHTIENVSSGVYEVRVRATDALGNNSPFGFSAALTVDGMVLPPPALASFTASGELLAIRAKWSFPEGAEASLATVIEYTNQDPTVIGFTSQTINVTYPQTEHVFNGLGANAKLWMRAGLMDKYQQVGEMTGWVSAVADANPDQLIDLISGHIGESTLDQILKGKIDGAIGLAGEANNLAEQANTAATNAQTTADQATVKAQEAANAASQEAADRAAAIQAGITQVTTEYTAADSVIYGELNAYKSSNDSAMSTVVQKAESAVAAGTTNSQAITELTGQVQAINNTKLDASVISDYYTKGQADDKSAEIAAGKIESYDANLVIGGTNLYSGPNPIPMVGQTSEGTYNAASAYFGVIQLYKYLENSWFELQDVAIGDDVITSLEIMVPSDSVVGEHSIYIGTYRFGNGWYLQSEPKPLKEFPRDKWVKVAVPAGKFVDASLTAPSDINISIYLSGCDVGTSFKWRNLMMEKGTKASAFAVSDKTLQSGINVNANAIQTTNAEVSRINDEVISTVSSVNNLTSSVGLLEGSINEVRQTVTNNQESTNTLVTELRSGMADADDLSMMMRNATVVYEDLNFSNGFNGVEVYNNHFNGALAANFTDKLPDNPVASTRQLQFIHSGGATTPELGGFYQATYSRPNGVFIVKFVAKLPVGYAFNLAANAYGDGSNGYFIGSSEGTGKFKTYHAVYRCGATGSFSTVGFVYVVGALPTPENPLIWYLASSTVYDCLDSKVAPDSVVNGIAEAKSTASTAINKAEASAILAQNLQTALDNTNANIATNYYTKSSTDQAIASATNQLSSSFDTAINNVGVIHDTRYDNQPPSWYWANYPHRTAKEFKYSGNLGIPVATVDTLGVLETTVPWVDPSGGPIQQKFMWQDSAYALTRYSLSQNEWSAWASAINEVKAAVDRKLDASVISNYYTKAEADNVVAGKVEQFSSSVLTSNENLFKGNILNVYKVYASGITAFNYTDYWVIDAAAGNGNYIALSLGVSPETLNNNGLYAGSITVSMDYTVESGSPEALPQMYFGHGYQTFIHSTDGPHVHSKWYRIYTTFYTDANNLLSNPHFGVGGIAGRICIRNLKIERGNMTAYSVDVRETTQSINGIEAIKTVTIDNNGVMSGYGLISELKNGQVTSSFGVNADTFYIGSPSLDKKPFIQRNDWSEINGVWVPPGTYIDTAFIANATIGLAHINTASIGSLSALSANLGTFTSTAADGSTTTISGSLFQQTHPNGKILVRLGRW